MEKHLTNIRTAVIPGLDGHASRHDPAHATLIQVLCEAMAAQVPPADAAEAANMSLSELFNMLRNHG